MTPPTTLPPPPPAVHRPATSRRQERKPEPPPTYPSIFREFRDDQRPAVQSAIDALVSANRSVSVLRVQECLAGILPATDRPPTVATPLLPPVVETVQVIAAPDFDEAAQMARLAQQMSARRPDRLAERIARCYGRTALTEAQEAEYQASLNRVHYFADGHTERLIQGWGYLPASNRYQRECTPCP